MDDRQYQAYLEVIDALLSCPTGAEEAVYKQFAHLIDTNLVIMMSVVAEMLEEQGSPHVDRLRQLRTNLAARMEEWQDLLQQAMEFSQQGDTPAEISYTEQALNLARAIFYSPNQELAISLNNLASLYQSQGRWAEAEDLFQESLNIYRELPGEEAKINLVSTLNNLGGLYITQGKWQEAESLYQEAIGICDRLDGEVNNDLARSLNNLGHLYQIQGRWVEAEPLIKTALTIRRHLFGNEANNDLASSLNNLALLYDVRGNWQEAEPLYIEALAIRRQLFKDEANKDVATSLNNLAAVYKAQGKWQDAEPLLQESLKIYRHLCAPVNKELAGSLNNLAALYESQERWADAEPLYEEAVDIYRELFRDEPNNELATILNNLAVLYYAQGRSAQAEHLFLEVVKIRRELFRMGINNDLATSLNNLASLYTSQGRCADAEPLYEESVRICRELFGATTNHDLAASLNNLAGCYKVRERWADAELLYREVVSIYRQLFGGETNQDLATGLNNLGGLYCQQERWQEAEDLFLEALSIFRHLFGDRANKKLASCLNNLAIFYVTTKRYPAALELFIEAIQVQNRLLADYFGYAIPENQSLLLEQMHSNLEAFVSVVWQHFPHERAAQAAALDAILKRKAASTISNSILNAAQYNDRYPHLRPQFDKWQQLKQQIALGGDRLDESTRKQLEDECRQLYQQLARQVPEIKATSMDIDRQAIALYLPANSILVEFFRFEVYDFQASELLEKKKPARYLAFIITPDSDIPAELIDLGAADPIDELVRKYRHVAATETLAMDDDDEDTELPLAQEEDTELPLAQEEDTELPLAQELEIGSQLRTHLLDPILERVSTADTLILAADGDLYRVPFATLPLKDTGERIIDRYRVETLTAARDLRRRSETIVGVASRNENRPAAPPLLVADPDYNYGVVTSDLASPPQVERDLAQSSTLGTKFAPLPTTCQLANSLATRLEINPYLDRAATETLFHNQPRSPQYLIVATHGFADPQHLSTETDPMQRCGIALAGANGWLQQQPLPPEVGKGVLLAHDLAQLNLWGTEIVVLVACSTALGETKSGQGIFGLRRALALAGARHAIVSLWDVPTRASMLLMNYFFDGYLAGVAPSLALHQAQNRICHSTIQELSQSPLGQEILEELHAIGKIDNRTPRDRQPLRSPYFWGAWICQG
jgi:tetratricopeptide (TPR) repeat protein